MVACVSPAGINIEESLNTLRYAENTRLITNVVKQNVETIALSASESAAILRENNRLKEKVVEFKKRFATLERNQQNTSQNTTTGLTTDVWKLKYDKLLGAAKVGFSKVRHKFTRNCS